MSDEPAAPPPVTPALDVGFHYDVPAERYHADPAPAPSLSRSVAAEIIMESCFHGYLAHPRLGAGPPRVATKAMDFGSVGHKLMLNRGAVIARGHWDDFKTDASQTWRDAMRAEGKIPVLEHTFQRAVEFAKGCKGELERLGLFKRFIAATSEVVAIWKEDKSYCRCMFDKIFLDEKEESCDIFDIKVTEDANPRWLPRHINDMNYDLQAYFYKRGVEVLRPNMGRLSTFTFLFFSSKPPYQLVPVELTGLWKAGGSSKYASAHLRWQNCMETGVWPGYATGILNPEAPGYYQASITDP